MSDKSQLELIFDEWEAVIADVITNGISLDKQRKMIQIKTRFIQEIGTSRKSIKDKWLNLKTRENRAKQQYIQDGMAKTPAGDQALEDSRSERYELEKLEIDIETMQDIAMNRNYHLRINEIDVNKVWVGTE